ncbi:MAG: GFA family protein [Deltaproteobacteria bacterium]
MKKTYRGSCHCKRVAFAADIDLTQGTSKCNCTFCWKNRNWGAQLMPEDFRLEKGADDLSGGDRGGFCRFCGVRCFGVYSTDGWGEGFGGDRVSVSVSVLDDLPVEELLEAPVRHLDGLRDDWFTIPKETRHL